MLADSVKQFRAVISGNIEGVEQGIELLKNLTNEEYCMRAEPYLRSCIGEHLRHILDLYDALRQATAVMVIDYDQRRRGAAVESDRAIGLAELQQIKTWLLTLEPDIGLDKIVISTEVSLQSKQVAMIETSLLRELVFVSNHAVHHYALINISAQLCALKTPVNMGIAPATLTALRNEVSCVQ